MNRVAELGGFVSTEGNKWIEEFINKPDADKEYDKSKLGTIFNRICLFQAGLSLIWQSDLEMLDEVTDTLDDRPYEFPIIDRASAISWLKEFNTIAGNLIFDRIIKIGDEQLIEGTSSMAVNLRKRLRGEENNISISKEEFKSINRTVIEIQSINYGRKYLSLPS